MLGLWIVASAVVHVRLPANKAAIGQWIKLAKAEITAMREKSLMSLLPPCKETEVLRWTMIYSLTPAPHISSVKTVRGIMLKMW